MQLPDDVDSSKRVYVTEGPFDSMFVFNSVAMAGSDANVPFDNAVMIYDNEPRSKEIIDTKTIDNKYFK